MSSSEPGREDGAVPPPLHGLTVARAIEKLSRSETDLSRARRLASLAREPGLQDVARIDLLGRLLRVEPRMARHTGLRLVGDASPAVREAIAGVLAVTPGCDDDLPVLLSLVAGETVPEIRQAFQAVLDTLKAPSTAESLSVLCKLLGRPPTAERLDAARLLPHAEDRALFWRWVNKTWCREAGPDVRHYLVAVLELAGLMVDQLVVAGAASLRGDGTFNGQIDAVRHRLFGRPTPLELSSDAVILKRWPWLERHRHLAGRYGPVVAAGTTDARLGLTWADGEAAATELRLFGGDWVEAMYALTGAREAGRREIDRP